MRFGALEIGEVDQWGGMESREVDCNLRIVHCFGRKMENRSVDRIGPSIAPLVHSPMLQGARRPEVVTRMELLLLLAIFPKRANYENY